MAFKARPIFVHHSQEIYFITELNLIIVAHCLAWKLATKFLITNMYSFYSIAAQVVVGSLVQKIMLLFK